MANKQMPSYIKIKEALNEDIRAGKLSPGSRIPTERELARKFSVSRMTARHAVRELEQDGLVVRKQGSGTYVAINKISQELKKITSFSETLRQKGVEPGAVTLRTSVEPAGPSLAGILKIDPKDLITIIDQLRLANGSPVSIIKLRVVNSFCPNLSAEDVVAGDYYEIAEKKFGVTIETVEHNFEAVAADREEAKLLQVKIGFPLMKVQRIAYDQRNRPVNYSLAIFRSDKYFYKTVLHKGQT